MIVYVKNRLPHAALSTTPFEAFSGKKHWIAHFRVFGETGYAYMEAEARPAGIKLEPRAREVRICGYGGSSGMYRVYDPAKPHVFISRIVRFGSPLVEEDKKESNEDSNTHNHYSSDSDTTTPSTAEEEQEEEEDEEEEGGEDVEDEGEEVEEEGEEVGNNNIPDSESERDTDEEEIKELLQHAAEPVPESLLGDHSEFEKGKEELILFLDESVYTTSHPESPLPTRRSGRTSRPPSRLVEYQSHLAAANLEATERKNYAEAITGDYQDEWNQSIKEESYSHRTPCLGSNPSGPQSEGSRQQMALRSQVGTSRRNHLSQVQVRSKSVRPSKRNRLRGNLLPRIQI